jgi:hypothetical protein
MQDTALCFPQSPFPRPNPESPSEPDSADGFRAGCLRSKIFRPTLRRRPWTRIATEHCDRVQAKSEDCLRVASFQERAFPERNPAHQVEWSLMPGGWRVPTRQVVGFQLVLLGEPTLGELGGFGVPLLKLARVVVGQREMNRKRAPGRGGIDRRSWPRHIGV